MADNNEVKNDVVAQEVESDEKPDYKALKKDFDRTQKELSKLQAKAKQEADAKLSETEKLQKELETYKTRAAQVDAFENDYAEQRDELLGGLHDAARSKIEDICDGLDVRKQIKLIKEFARATKQQDDRADESRKVDTAVVKAKNAVVHRTPPSQDGVVHFFEDYQSLPQADKFKFLKEKGAANVAKLPRRS